MKTIILTLTASLSFITAADNYWYCEVDGANMFGGKVPLGKNPHYARVTVSPGKINVLTSTSGYKGPLDKTFESHGITFYSYKAEEGVTIMWVPGEKRLVLNYKNFLRMHYKSCQESVK